MIASIHNMVKRYGDQTVVDHLNIDVREGEILGLLGPNGAGKSTAIKALSGLIDIDGGEITLFNQKQSIKNLEARKELGLVTQDITVIQALSLIENLKYFGGLYGLRGAELKARVDEVLDFIELKEHIKKKPKQLSGGMQRRLNIGCALLHRPKLVIMDEPTVGIDPQSRNHILESTKKLAEAGTTVIYTSHYMEEVEAICDRIVIMDVGRVIAQGTAEELVQQIQHEHRVKLTAMQGSDALTENLEAIAGVKHVSRHNNTYVIASILGSGNMNRITEVAQLHGGIASITEEVPSLEDVFLTLTGKKLREGGDVI